MAPEVQSEIFLRISWDIFLRVSPGIHEFLWKSFSKFYREFTTAEFKWEFQQNCYREFSPGSQSGVPPVVPSGILPGVLSGIPPRNSPEEIHAGVSLGILEKLKKSIIDWEFLQQFLGKFFRVPTGLPPGHLKFIPQLYQVFFQEILLELLQ